MLDEHPVVDTKPSRSTGVRASAIHALGSSQALLAADVLSKSASSVHRESGSCRISL